MEPSLTPESSLAPSPTRACRRRIDPRAAAHLQESAIAQLERRTRFVREITFDVSRLLVSAEHSLVMDALRFRIRFSTQLIQESQVVRENDNLPVRGFLHQPRTGNSLAGLIP
jgi:hypothetical protein